MNPAPPLFVFDGDCGFCRKWATWVERRIDGGATFVTFQSIDLDALGLSVAEVSTASYWVDERGRRFRGNRSFARALRRASGAWRLLGVVGDLPVVRHGLSVVYRWVAGNRHRLPAPEL